MQLPDNPHSKIDKKKVNFIKELTEGKEYNLVGHYRYLVETDEEKHYVSASNNLPHFTISRNLDSNVQLNLIYGENYYKIPYTDITSTKEGVTITDGHYRARFEELGEKLKLGEKTYLPRKI